MGRFSIILLFFPENLPKNSFFFFACPFFQLIEKENLKSKYAIILTTPFSRLERISPILAYIINTLFADKSEQFHSNESMGTPCLSFGELFF